MIHIRKLVKYLVRVKVLAYAFVRDWVRVRVGIRLDLENRGLVFRIVIQGHLENRLKKSRASRV